MNADHDFPHTDLPAVRPRQTWIRRNAGLAVLCGAAGVSALETAAAFVGSQDTRFGWVGFLYGGILGLAAAVADRFSRVGSANAWGLTFFVGTVGIGLAAPIFQYHYGFQIVASRKWQVGFAIGAIAVLVLWLSWERLLQRFRPCLAVGAGRATPFALVLALMGWCLRPLPDPAPHGITGPPSTNWTAFSELLREHDEITRSLRSRRGRPVPESPRARALRSRIASFLEQPLGSAGASVHQVNFGRTNSIFGVAQKLLQDSATGPSLEGELTAILLGRRIREVAIAVPDYRAGVTAGALGAQVLETEIPLLTSREQARALELKLAAASRIPDALEQTLRVEPWALRERLRFERGGGTRPGDALDDPLGTLFYPIAADYQRFCRDWELERTSSPASARRNGAPVDSPCEYLAIATPFELRRMTRWHDANLRVIALAAALRRFELETGSLPAELSGLTGIPPETLRDPNSPGNLTYRRLGPRRYVLYSVGPDGKDDGGSPLGGNLSGRGDQVFGNLYPRRPPPRARAGTRTKSRSQ